MGIKRVFERQYGGWLSIFGDGHRTYPEQIYAGLGTVWETERIDRSSPTRPWDSCTPRSTPPSSYAPRLSVSEIRPDRDRHARSGLRHGGWKAERPLETIGAQMNVAYAVAVALLDGDVLIDQFSTEADQPRRRVDLIDRTVAHHEGLRPAAQWTTG